MITSTTTKSHQRNPCHLVETARLIVDAPLQDNEAPFVAGVAFGVAEQPRVEVVHAAVQRPDFREDLLDVLVHGVAVAPWCGRAHGSAFIARNRRIANTVFRATAGESMMSCLRRQEISAHNWPVTLPAVKQNHRCRPRGQDVFSQDKIVLDPVPRFGNWVVVARLARKAWDRGHGNGRWG